MYLIKLNSSQSKREEFYHSKTQQICEEEKNTVNKVMNMSI